MAAKEVASSDPVPQDPEVQTKDTQPVKPSSRLPSAVTSPIDDVPRVDWNVCPHCGSAKSDESKSAVDKAPSSSSSSSPTTSDLSHTRSTSFARLGHRIKGVLSHTSETTVTSTAHTKARVVQKKKARSKKPKKSVKPESVAYESGYEELGADHWADDY